MTVSPTARHTPGIDKGELGQYLGAAGSTKGDKNTTLSKEVLAQYVLTFNCSGLELSEAVR